MFSSRRLGARVELFWSVKDGTLEIQFLGNSPAQCHVEASREISFIIWHHRGPVTPLDCVRSLCAEIYTEPSKSCKAHSDWWHFKVLSRGLGDEVDLAPSSQFQVCVYKLLHLPYCLGGKKGIWCESNSFLSLDQGSAIFLCKGPDSEYFWLRGPHCLYGNYSLCCCHVKMGTDNAEMNEHGCIPEHLWALKFEFQIFTCHETLHFCMFFFFLSSNCLNSLKATISSKALQVQVVEQIWTVIHWPSL